MPRPKNTDQRRHEIAQALLKVMAEEGYAAATIQAIAKQAGLNPGLIHYHFANKQEILIELVRWVAAQGEERYQQRLASAETPKAQLQAFIEARLALDASAIPEAVAAWVVIGTEAIRQPEVRAEYEKAIDQQQTELRRLLKGLLPPRTSTKRIEHLAAIVLAAIEGAFQLSVSAQEIMPKGYAAPALLRLVENLTIDEPKPKKVAT